jgi:hypothetical protein
MPMLTIVNYREGNSAKGEYEIFIVQDVMRKAGSSGFNEGQECEFTWDALCEGGLECGKRSNTNETYVCCKETFVPFGWTTDLCKQENEGDLCGTTSDDECLGSLECGKRSMNDDTYVCCKETFVPLGWTTDVCAQNFKEGEECPSTRDDDCEGSLECGKRSKDDETYICCKETYVPFLWTTDVCI